MMNLNYNQSENAFNEINIFEDKSDQLNFRKKQIIYNEGNTPLGVYYVAGGKVKLSRIGSDGKEQILKIASDGDVLGYHDLILNSRYTNSAEAIDETNVMFIPRQDFMDTIKSKSDLFEKLFQMLSRELINAEIKMADLAYKPVRGRLADALLNLSKKYLMKDQSNSVIAITRKDLASFVGTAKETVNRLLSEFRKENLISTDGTKINILNINGLQHVSRLYD